MILIDQGSQEGDLTQGKGGMSLQVELDNKPALLRSEGMSQTVFTLQACGLNVPHLHSRAAKMLYVLEGEQSGPFDGHIIEDW